MADIKLSQLGQITTLEDTDILLVSQDSGGGLFISKRISVSDLTTEIGGGGGGSSIPVGGILIWPGSLVPLGFLECNGAAVSRTGFSVLFTLIAVHYGAGNGSTTFNVPDYRGEFLRGWAHGSTNDPDKASRTNRGDGVTGDNIGTKQATQLKAHNHLVAEYSGAQEGVITFSHINANTNGDIGNRTGSTGGSESRPRNVNVMYIIKT